MNIVDEHLGRRMRGAIGESRGRSVHNVNTEFDRLYRYIRCKSGQTMRMQLQRKAPAGCLGVSNPLGSLRKIASAPSDTSSLILRA